MLEVPFSPSLQIPDLYFLFYYSSHDLMCPNNRSQFCCSKKYPHNETDGVITCMHTYGKKMVKYDSEYISFEFFCLYLKKLNTIYLIKPNHNFQIKHKPNTKHCLTVKVSVASP